MLCAASGYSTYQIIPPLSKTQAFIFIYKPTLYIPFKDIETVAFDRVGGAVGAYKSRTAHASTHNKDPQINNMLMDCTHLNRPPTHNQDTDISIHQINESTE